MPKGRRISSRNLKWKYGSSHVGLCSNRYGKVRMHGVLFFILLYFGLCWVSPVVPAFSSCGEQGYSLVALHRLLTAVVSLVVELGL